MKNYKEPGFQARIASAATARNDVLDKLRTRAPVDPEIVAARAAAAQAREAAQQEKHRLSRLAAEERKAEKQAKALEAAAEKAAKAAKKTKPVLTEAERKAARDARYLARKNR